MRATGIGSMPGTDVDAVCRWIVDTFASDLLFIPELPARGAHAAMIGRTLGQLELPVDLHVGRWRAGAAQGLDQGRARSMFRQDLDAIEEALHGEHTRLKQQFVGPFTLAASVETRTGQSLLSDHGAVRDVASALAQVVAEHVRELARRFGHPPVIQIDEPSAPAVFGGRIKTASGYGRHRSVDAETVRELWGGIVKAVRDAGGEAVLHCCADSVPVTLAQQSGFGAIAFDLSLAKPHDEWASAFESGLAPWVGSLDARAIEEFLGRLGFSLEALHEDLVLTPPCGLAYESDAQARETLSAVIGVRGSLSR
ncbi:MAG: methionine synthase [Aeromicrobium sp.]|nr:MAG: methionine synthase [Aeromicrobium sp.]